MLLTAETRLASSLLHLLLYARRWLGLDLGGRCSGAMDFDMRDLDRMQRAFAVGAHASDFLNQLDRGVIALAEDGIAAIEAGVGNLGDEELRAVGAGSGIGVGETPRAIELDRGRSLILERVAGIA